ncbi:MAG: PEGA domain-containing protein [Deltaproteobacteria bacterium]|nr:MAG: PEGA domain-containing protein [Deltaproteobacteria bacterium]
MLGPGDRFGEYVILKRLAAGGMAEVYLARKGGLGGFTKPVAIKIILPHLSSNPKFVKMFLAEARLVVYLEHSNIAQVLDLGEVDGQYFITMEFAHGADLQRISSRTKKSGRLLPLPYAAKIVSQIAEGLHYAHTKTDEKGKPLGIIHRDISPHNIILTFDGIAKLIDFGVAKAKVDFIEEEEGVLKGKFSYMSPEQIRGMPLDARSDVFALGVVLWEVCTGANLYRESSELLTMEAILRKPVPPPRQLRGDMPPDLEAIILKALAKRSVDRFQSALEFHQALERYLSRSGWTVGTAHLSEFMRKLFPEELEEIQKLIARERQRVEQEQKQQQFVPWEPYSKEELGIDPELAAPERRAEPLREPQVRQAEPQKRPQPRGAARNPGESGARPALLVAAVVLLVALLGIGGWMLLETSEDGGAGGAARAVRQVRSGSLEIESVPAGASVYVNGEEKGATPLKLNDLPLGIELTVRLKKEGFEDFVRPVVLTGAMPRDKIRAELSRR